MDHGVLNVPLSKRGDIDAQIDAWKRDQAKAAAVDRKAKAATLAEQRKQAKAIVAAMSPERIAELATKLKTTAGNVRSMLKSEAHWSPARLIAAQRA